MTWKRPDRITLARLAAAAIAAWLSATCAAHAQAQSYQPSRLYWSTDHGGLFRVGVDDPGSIETLLAQRLHDSTALTIDEAGNRLYIRQRTPNAIVRCETDGSNEVPILTGTAWNGSGLDIDPITGKIYWVESRKIRRADLDGSNREIVLTDPAMHPSLATVGVDPVGRKMYWIAISAGALRRANLDGTMVEDILVHPRLAYSPTIRIDGSAGRVYVLVADRIGSIGVDGSRPRLVHAGSDIEAFALDSAGGKIYWEDSGQLSRANLDGTAAETLTAAELRWLEFHQAEGVLYALDAGERGPLRIDPQTLATTYLWQPRVQRIHGEPAIDSIAGKIYWHDRAEISRASLDGTRRQHLTAQPAAPSVALDGAGYVYWYAPDQYAIMRSRVDGTGVQPVAPPPFGRAPIDLEIDAANAKLYVLYDWKLPGNVARMSLDGSGLESLAGATYATDIEIDATAGRAYLSSPRVGQLGGRIIQTDLDFTSLVTLIGNIDPRSMAVDTAAGKIYWADYPVAANPILLRRADLDGSNVEDFVQLPAGTIRAPRGLTIETLLPTELTCRLGNVNADGSGRVDVLLVNGSTGGVQRRISVPAIGPLAAEMASPPTADNRAFLVHANFGEPDAASVDELPSGLGRSCFPFLVSSGAMPAAVWNGLGKPQHVGASTGFDGAPVPDPGRTPFTFLSLPTGDPVYLPAGTVVTFQGIIQDPSSLAMPRASVTNAVVVRFE